MAHREKSAWLALIAMAIAFVPYFTLAVIDPPTAPLPDLDAMATFALAVTAQVIVLAIGHAILRLRAPEDATAPADERDRAIAARSLRTAYLVLIVGTILTGCVLPFYATGWTIIQTAVFTIVLAESSHYGTIVWSYRRGW